MWNRPKKSVGTSCNFVTVLAIKRDRLLACIEYDFQKPRLNCATFEFLKNGSPDTLPACFGINRHEPNLSAVFDQMMKPSYTDDFFAVIQSRHMNRFFFERIFL